MVLLRGAHPVREHIIAYLKTAVPAMCELAVEQWADTLDYDFEVPEHYSAYEDTGMSHGDAPRISVGVSRSNGYGRVDFTAVAEEQYRPTYTVRVFTHTFTPNAQEEVPENARYVTLRARDDLAAIVKSCVLDRPSLGQPDLFEVLLGTLTEEYLEATPTPNNSGRFIATVVTTFDLRVDESQFRTALGQVPDTGVAVGVELMEGN